jgi:FixJ family two-component response regulator
MLTAVPSFCYMAVPVLISVVDDDASVREALCRLLRTVGFEVNAFASAEEYLSSDQPKKPDCLILDVCMPGMSGIELQRQLLASHCEIPAIFITAHEDESIRTQALRGHASPVLMKPFSDEALLNAIHTALSS